MTTKYYWTPPAGPTCPTCGHYEAAPELLIGMSAIGWVFLVATHEVEGIRTLDDWRDRWESGGTIRDEYGAKWAPADMLARITERGRDDRVWTGADYRMMAQNRAAPGPRGLFRSVDAKPDPGGGTWEYREAGGWS